MCVEKNHRITLVLLAIVCIAGCGETEDPAAAQQEKLWTEGTKVEVIKTVGEHARVRTEDGAEAYVPVALLREVGIEGNSLTHELLAATAPLEEQPPRHIKAILREQLSLNRLYISESGEEIIAPRNPWLSEPRTASEPCWRAMTCTSPDCPGKDSGRDGRPFLFTLPGNSAKVCPECKKVRGNANSLEEQAYNAKWVRPYDLPETAERIKELDAERKRGQEIRSSR